MTPYKGIIKIECEAKGPCPQKLRENVKAECVICPMSVTRIVDLEGKVLSEVRDQNSEIKEQKSKIKDPDIRKIEDNRSFRTKYKS